MRMWHDRPRVVTVLAGAALLINMPLYATEKHWRTFSDAPAEIAVQYRELDRGHIEIRAEREVQSSLGAFLHLLEQVDAVHTWVDRAKSATILARPNANTFVVHTEFHGAFVISDRSMITVSQWQQNPQTLQLTLTVRDASADYVVDTDDVMLQDVKATWQLTPRSEGSMTIRYVGSAHPGGHIPLFLAKRQALKSIVQTFNNLPSALAKYQKPYPEVSEPPLTER